MSGEIRAFRPEYLAHEWRVGWGLSVRGWIVGPAGLYALGGDQVVAALQRTRSVLRWLPDLVAIREETVVMVDAKHGRTDCPTFGIDEDVLDSGERYRDAGISVAYVWPDLSANWADEVLAERHALEVASYSGSNYSGKQLRRWPRVWTHPFDDLFGARL